MIAEIEGPFGFLTDSDLHFDGNPLEFQWLVRWGILMRELYKEKNPDPLEFLLDTEKAEAELKERGITERAITMEMIRNGLELALSYHENKIADEKSTCYSLAAVQDEMRTVKEQIDELTTRLGELKKKERDLQFEKLRPVVGMAFRTKLGDVRIIGLPEIEHQKTGESCNMYRFPVLVIDSKDDETIPFYEGKLYSQAVNSDDPENYLRSEYEEINAGDWFGELDEAIDKMKRKL